MRLKSLDPKENVQGIWNSSCNRMQIVWCHNKIMDTLSPWRIVLSYHHVLYIFLAKTTLNYNICLTNEELLTYVYELTCQAAYLIACWDIQQDATMCSLGIKLSQVFQSSRIM